MITDRLRFTVIEANTNKILSTDLAVSEPQISGQLSAPSIVTFKVPQGESGPGGSAEGLYFKSWAYYIVTEIEIDGERQIVGCGITTENCKIDPKTGDFVVEAIGFSNYPKGISWQENWNDIAVDPFEIVQRIYSHLQSYSNANLGIEVSPASSGTQMLPGYGFDGSILVFDFFALFIRAVDFTDCGDFITSLARDIPFDYFERATWNANRTELSKTLELAYPSGGLRQDHLTFVLGENVYEAELADEKDIEWTSDVLIRGWFPGKVYSSRLSNADPKRFRRTILEEDAMIDSTERAAAWAKKKLQRRSIPKYWSKILIDPNHDSGQFGLWREGDLIWVEGEYPWLGVIADWHKVMGWTYDEASGMMQVQLQVEGAFNYDPIEYDPDGGPTEDVNLILNGYFNLNLSGWKSLGGTWIRVGNIGYDTEGSVRVDCDDAGEYFESHRVSVLEGKTYEIKCAVRYRDIVSTNAIGLAIGLKINTYLDGGNISSVVIDEVESASGTHTWIPLMGEWTCPTGVNELSVQLTVTDKITAGVTWWDDVKVTEL